MAWCTTWCRPRRRTPRWTRPWPRCPRGRRTPRGAPRRCPRCGRALHTRGADELRVIGPAEARASCLDIAAILRAARSSGAQAIHPGYGFLAEQAGFAAAVEEAGLAFIGPTPEQVRAMGDKRAA